MSVSLTSDTEFINCDRPEMNLPRWVYLCCTPVHISVACLSRLFNPLVALLNRELMV